VLFAVCLTVWENAGMPDKLQIMTDYEYQGIKKEIHKLKYIVFKIYILSIRFRFCYVVFNSHMFNATEVQL
jgi:hypothetical protein